MAVPAAADERSESHVTAAASAAIGDLLDGEPQPAELIGRYPVAAYLRIGARVVAVTAPEAVRLPNASVVGRSEFAAVAAQRRPTVTVGGGGLRIGSVGVVVRRWWDPVPHLARLDRAAVVGGVSVARARLPAWPDPDHPAAGALAAGRNTLAAFLASGQTASAGHHDEVRAAVAGLVGLGPGLTPAGDDLLAGLVGGLVVFGRAAPDGSRWAGEVAASLADEAARLSGRTTILAADLAGHAAVGAMAEPAAALCHALAGARPLDAAVDGLVAVGHTSGRDLAEGLLIAAVAAGAGV